MESDDDFGGCGLPVWIWAILILPWPILEVTGNVASAAAVFVDYFDKPAETLEGMTIVWVGVAILAALISGIILGIKGDSLGSSIMIGYAALNLLVGLAFGYTQTYFRFLF